MGVRNTSPSSQAARAVDRQLKRYRAMRDFQATAEPHGGSTTALRESGLPFVVQKHSATRLHYDFRLGWRGVLKSWAVAKGPSYSPGDKRLAVQVEDHPIEYGGFEGTIPKGQYGGGTVMVWDQGEWEPEGDVDRGLRDGHLKFALHGTKLKGRWALVRMHGHGERADKPNWLLIKEKDEYAQLEGAVSITDAEPNSVVTGRSIEEIAESDDHVWNSSSKSNDEAQALTPARPSTLKKRTSSSFAARKMGAGAGGKPPQLDSLLKAAAHEPFPKFIAPQLAQQSPKPPSGAEWVHELKLDGYRIQIHAGENSHRKDAERKAALLTRNGLDWTLRMPEIALAASRLVVDSAILDGEVVVLDREGRSSFSDLQAAFQERKRADLIYFAFDILHLNGRNVRELPLLQRKEILAAILGQTGNESPLRISEYFDANGDEMFAKACSLGAEGIVSKLASAKYTSGRAATWLKVKCRTEQELVIGGFTLPSKGGRGVGALLLGYYDGKKLRYAGRAGTGFTDATQRMLRSKLDLLKQAKPAFAAVPRGAQKDAHWVKPKLIAQIAFATWTRDGIVRQAAFKGLREDKAPAEVVREVAVSAQDPAPATARTARRAMTGGKRDHKEKTAMIAPSITHPNKVLDEESGMTKQALADYYLAVANNMLPHIEDRPFSVVRCPAGSGKPCFYQKHVGVGLPAAVNSVSIPNRKTGKKEEFLTLDTREGLVGLAQMGVLEIHPWGSRNESLERPDRIVFDLDPGPGVEWDQLAECASELRQKLKNIGLEAFLKSTGGKGLHLVVPIEPENEWAAVKQFAHNLVLGMEKEHPDLYITKMTKAARANRIYLDYLRNDRESTAVAPWSPRARSGAPVAAPLEWKELRSPQAPKFHVSDFERWKSRLGKDPWKKMSTVRQHLPKAI